MDRFRRLYGFIVSTYESAGTRRFAFGRVDCIRSATSEALEWAKAMCQGAGPNVPLESDKEEEESSTADDNKKVTFSIYSVSALRVTYQSRTRVVITRSLVVKGHCRPFSAGFMIIL